MDRRIGWFVLTICSAAAMASASVGHAAPPLDWQTGRAPARRIDTVAAWENQRTHILQAMEEVMGPLPRPVQPVPLNWEVLSTTQDGPIVRKKIAYHTDDPKQRVHAWLLVPRDAQRPLPAMLCLHQTVAAGKDEPAGIAGDPELAYARELAERGVAALAPDYPSFGEYDYDFDQDAYQSGSMKAIYDNLRAVDLLTELEEIDGQRLGVIGHSLGGHNAIFTAVFDRRLRVVVTSCGFTSFAKYYDGDLTGWTSPRYMPRIESRYHSDPGQMPFDFTDLGAALAPRPWMAVAPLDDHNFAVAGVRDVMAAALPVYRLYGAADQLRPKYPDCGHQFPPASRREAYHFILSSLQTTENKSP